MKIVEKQAGRASGWVSFVANAPDGPTHVWVAAVPTGRCLSGTEVDPITAEAFLDDALGELNANPRKPR